MNRRTTASQILRLEFTALKDDLVTTQHVATTAAKYFVVGGGSEYNVRRLLRDAVANMYGVVMLNAKNVEGVMMSIFVSK